MIDLKLYRLILHGEGFSSKPYKDTKGLWTWGIGRCYERYPLTLAERRRIVSIAPSNANPENDWDIDLTTMVLCNLSEEVAGKVAQFMVTDVLQTIIPLLEQRMVWWNDCDEVRRAVWTDWAYNMGLGAVCSFGNTAKLMSAKQYDAIAKACLTWPWADDVGKNPPHKNNPHGQRAWYLSQMMATGKWPTFCL